jgi:outer membrane protein assembly factor BamB
MSPRTAGHEASARGTEAPVRGGSGWRLVLAGCFDQSVGPLFDSDGRLSVTNDELALDPRMSYPDTPVPIDPDPSPAASGSAAVSGPSGAPAMAPSSVTLTLIGEVAPPTVGGLPVQAAAVWATSQDRAIVSYNRQGSTAVGALDWFTSLRNGRPSLRSSLQFATSDVSAAFTDGSWAFAATATSEMSFTSPSVLERIRIQSDRFQLDTGNMRIQLTSFAATSAAATDNEIYATSGDGGHVFAFDDNTMALRGQYALDDARWVAVDAPNNRVVVLQGTPGRLAVFQEGSFPGGSMTLLNTFPFPGADVAESKSAMEIAGGKAYVAAGTAGVQVICLSTGQIIATVPRPDPVVVGLDPSVVVTNAVTVEGDLMFISNGEAGVYAAAGSRDFDDTSCSPMTITVLGKLRFNNLQSVNHVEYENGNLFIAAGTGGTKVVDVDTN